MPTKAMAGGLDLIQQYGMANFLTLAIVILMFFLIRWILKTGDKREERLGSIITDHLTRLDTSLQSTVSAIQTLQQTARDSSTLAQTRYDSITEANRFQRQEHDRMIDRLEALHADLKDGAGCASKP